MKPQSTQRNNTLCSQKQKEFRFYSKLATNNVRGHRGEERQNHLTY
jgi:hypothetical protein